MDITSQGKLKSVKKVAKVENFIQGPCLGYETTGYEVFVLSKFILTVVPIAVPNLLNKA